MEGLTNSISNTRPDQRHSLTHYEPVASLPSSQLTVMSERVEIILTPCLSPHWALVVGDVFQVHTGKVEWVWNDIEHQGELINEGEWHPTPNVWT